MSSWTLESCGRLREVAGDALRPGGLELTRYLLGFGNFSEGSRILDAGCGMGATIHLSRTLRLAAVGVDRSWSLIAGARFRSPEIPLVCATLESLPFDEASFDGIVCECVLSQTDAGAVLDEFGRVVRGGGYLLLSDLYQKEAVTGAAGAAEDGRLATTDETLALIEGAGFAIAHWEDRTLDLRKLAVQLIMAPGPTEENLFGWCPKSSCSSGTATGSKWNDVGYQLIVARRMQK